ncbi:hypothetical protein E0Z10_g1695 [Xylaria hypoxylon]|uniref:Uncharacterized protein n=1 Tax=Xylaria hypoxylon TaxID=37992 RepID=A0A4Z0YSQ4_9PEZI|nr:hypothetical protein E0Z10_g1695 [Xylaria hypoxylon]
MEDGESLAVSPGTNATPLQPISPDRANHQNSMFGSPQGSPQRDSDVHNKIRRFNHLSHLPPNATSMSKQLERLTADAALKRAMIGREEAESEMRRFREESRVLRKQVEEGRERERKVGERLETVMVRWTTPYPGVAILDTNDAQSLQESYGRAKETYSHTQAIWEKEIRRARKETFKSQSSIVKLQEELKSARVATKSAEECLGREKELSKAREQEAFAARYQLIELQQELDKAQERITFLAEERDAFKTVAQSEEVARIAAEGRLPLPPEDPDSEFASPRKSFRGRESLSTFEIVSSAATEDELEELTRLWQWEKQRADRTQDHLEFVQAEFELHPSPKPKSSLRQSITTSSRKERVDPIEIVDPSDLVILGKDNELSKSPPPTEITKPEFEDDLEVLSEPLVIQSPTSAEEEPEEPKEQPERKEPRRGTIFVPAEGVFRTITQLELEAMERSSDDDEATLEPPTPVDSQPDPPRYARTPSVEPPSFALMVQERTSLLSLLNAPRESQANLAFNIPYATTDASSCAIDDDISVAEVNDTPNSPTLTESPLDARPHTSATFYTMTTTTSVPIQDENIRPHAAPLVFTHGRAPSFDVNNPALTPTMTREQALAQIRERRGRARSAMQGTMTPRRQMVTGVTDRNVSAPAGRAAKGRS